MKTILIDLDGVLNRYNGQFEINNIPEIKEGARDFLNALQQKYIVKIFTTRNNVQVKNWIKKNNLTEYITSVTNKKEPAHLILDDRCIKFEGDYNKALEDIENFKVWYK